MEDLRNVSLILFAALVYLLPVLGDYLYKKYKELYKRNISYDYDESFERIYANMNRENIEVMERNREKVRKNATLKIIIFLLILAVLLIININLENISQKAPLVVAAFFIQMAPSALYMTLLIGIGLIASKNNSRKIKEYEKKYKELILSNFINLYDKKLIYKSDIEDKEHLELRNEYYENNFSIGRTGKFDLLNVQNYIYGKTGDTANMNLYDVSVELINSSAIYSIITSEYSKLKTYRATSIFKGTYIVIDVDKQLPTSVRIYKNKILPINNKVDLDSNEFEKYFDVNSEDEILAVRILSADVMQMLTEFYKKYNIKFEIVLKERKIYINLHTAETFKIPIRKGINKELIYLYYAILEFATNLSKEINKALNEIEL